MSGAGFAEALASSRLGRNDKLEEIAAAVDWSSFAPVLAQLEPEGPGRPPFDPMLMFRAQLLARLYDLSDAELEQQLNDRVSFRRFVGLGLSDEAPDHTTLCRFRNRLVAQGLVQTLFDAFAAQLDRDGLFIKQGTILDASLVRAARAKPDKQENAKDKDAAFAKKEGKPGSHYGYKIHVGMDQGSRLIRRALATPANVNDTTPADLLICGDEKAVYADRAYASRARREALKARAIKDRIMHKTWGGGPRLTPHQARRNRLIAPRRAEVETIFAIFKHRLGFTATRYAGLAKTKAQLLMTALAYNMRRAGRIAAA